MARQVETELIGGSRSGGCGEPAESHPGEASLGLKCGQERVLGKR